MNIALCLRGRLLAITLLAIILLPMSAAFAQTVPGPGYLVRGIEGDNDVGEYFALTERPFGSFNGFFYLADQGRLIGSTCAGPVCSSTRSLTNPAFDRGRYVSAANRSALNNRPLVAYYDASNGDLMALDCASTDCSPIGGIERTLETVGNVGQDTAIVIDPVTGLGLIAYYDVDNGDIRLYRCATAACDSGSSVLVNGSNDRGHNASMVFGGSTLWIGYEDRTLGAVVVAKTQAPYNVFSFFIIANAAEPSLSADASGFLDMVWRETVANSLQRMRCLDATCTNADQIQLGAAGHGFRPSATRSSAGNLLVSQYDPASHSMRGTLCNDLPCSSPQALTFASAPGIAGKSLMRINSSGFPLVFYQDAVQSDVRSAQCTSAACSAFQSRTAINGHAASGARLAMRPDGRPVIAYIRDRHPWLALCSDTLCSSVAQVLLPGNNSDTRPTVRVRPDNRPIIYYASVGGSELYDCADANCSSGSARAVSGSGNSTSNVLEMALRTDGRPVLLYAVSNLNDVYVFDCADVNCTSGSPHLLVDEPTVNSAFNWNYAITIGPGDRPIILYGFNDNSGSQQRYVRCNDSACLSATVSSIGTSITFYATPLALRSDGHPVFIENGPNNLAICDTADCGGQARFPIFTGGIVRTLQLLSGDRPVYEAATVGSASVTVCDDPTCASAQQRLLLSNSETNINYQGSLGLDATGAAFVALEEPALADVMLAVPLPDAIFQNGFE